MSTHVRSSIYKYTEHFPIPTIQFIHIDDKIASNLKPNPLYAYQ